MSTTVATMRVITIYSSQGKNNNKIQFHNNATGAEIKARLKQEGYNIGSMKMIEGVRRSTIESDKAILPDGDFNLHLYPVKTKGGAKKKEVKELNRKEISAKVKSIISTYGDKAKEHFNKDKNYSNKTSEELDALITKWEKKHGLHTGGNETSIPAAPKTTKAAVTKGTTKAVAGVVDSLAANATKEENEEASKHSPDMAIKTSINLLKAISGHENQVNIEKAITELEKSLLKKPTKTEEELLREEHEDIMAGVEGIVR